ncbi:hypothetical protein C8Q74DRAFT_1249497 [Fomes fomentarius]|nr:hypothetical protein C8Q74DRAFT_1249497 [Fomes fomentarius]
MEQPLGFLIRTTGTRPRTYYVTNEERARCRMGRPDATSSAIGLHIHGHHAYRIPMSLSYIVVWTVQQTEFPIKGNSDAGQLP